MQPLRTYRLQAGLTQSELAQRCGFRGGQSRICLYEKGKRTPPIPIARKIIKELNKAGLSCTMDEVFP